MILIIESIILCAVFTLFVFIMSRDPIKTLYNYPLSMPKINFLNLPVSDFRFQTKKYINRSRRLRPSCGPSFCKNPPAG